jgi:maltose alpha-D-glucosyltransferase/alpha-amylase
LDPEQTAWTLFRDLCTDYLDAVGGTTPEEPPAASGWAVSQLPPLENPAPALRIALDHATALGETTADLHQALATYTEEPDVRPDQFSLLYQRSLYQSMRASIRQELAAIRRLTADSPQEIQQDLHRLLASEGSMLAQIDHIRRVPVSGQRTRIHGNYRLDEMRLIDGEFYVLDLSGDHTRPMSERRLKQSPLRDVAEMLRSLDYASLIAARDHDGEAALRHAAYWHRRVGEEFVTTYLEASAGSAALPTQLDAVDALLAAFGLTKVLREVHWELINRPDWISIALRGALRWVV